MRRIAVPIAAFVIALNISAQEIKSVSKIEELDVIKQSTKGNVVLYNFWATWCKPCVTEFPELMKLYSNYKDKGFEIVFISLDVPEDVETKVKPFLNKNGVGFTTYYSKFSKEEELINYYDKEWVGAIPSTYIYDKEGVLQKKILGSRSYEQFENEVKPFLN